MAQPTITSMPSTRRGPRVTPLTVEVRVARGRAARTVSPRSTLGDYAAAPDRPDPIALLEQQAATRVPELVPIRYGRMLVSPFAFYRGAALIMASDLSHSPTSGLRVQTCGDAHLSNFGVFGSPERSLLFDVNDFDETLPGPWEWDLKRLSASIVVLGRDRGFTRKQRAIAVQQTAAAYREEMANLATMRNLEVWYSRLDVDRLFADPSIKVADATRVRGQAALAKARTRDSIQAFDKLTHMVNGQPRIISDPPLIVPIEELMPEAEGAKFDAVMRKLLAAYRKTLQSDRRHLLEQFTLVHFARKVVGVGSVGTRAWIFLMLGRDDRDPLFLQVKEAQESVLAPYVGKSAYANQGERVVSGQHLMQAASDIFLGWERFEGIDGVRRDFYFRQLRDWKGSADPDRIAPDALPVYGRMCGWTLARAHARSGDRIAIAAYLGKSPMFDQAMVAFGEAYADQNERDYHALRAAVDEGRVTAITGI